MTTTSWTSLAVAALLLGVALTHPSVPDPPVRDVRPTRVDLAPAARHVDRPTTRLLTTDPVRDPHGISSRLVEDIDRVPAGARVAVSTYWIGSRRVLAALTRAHARGVVLHVVVAGVDRARTPGAVRLARLIHRAHDGSRWVWSAGAARTTGPGLMHEKTFRFSRVADERWVVVTGSDNVADDQDALTYAAMLRVSGRRDVWRAFERVGADQFRQRPLAHPLREYAGPGWSAYFLPMRDDDPDPALQRLRAIPAAPTTTVRVVMYSMWGQRAEALSNQLARIVQGGGRVLLVAGPTVDPVVRDRLTAAGVRVRPGCWPDRTFAHGKDMTASFVRSGRHQDWTWVGSDNWTDGGTGHDQAVLAVRDRAVHRAFVRFVDTLVHRPGGVEGSACPAPLD